MLDGFLDGGLGDFVESDATGLGGIEPQGLGQMPGDRLTLAVFIGCEPDGSGLVRQFLQFGHDFFLAGRDDIFRGEPVLQIDAQFLLLKVSYMADAGLYRIVISQKPPDGLGFLGRLDDD